MAVSPSCISRDGERGRPRADVPVLPTAPSAPHPDYGSENAEILVGDDMLLMSKESLQSLNEGLVALNAQLQELLSSQRSTSNDLQNVLYSTDMATLFLDTGLRLRLFTPTAKALFAVVPTDIGRPLAELRSLTADSRLLTDAEAVLRSHVSTEREIEAQSGAWYLRRILPYRTQDAGVEGVVITFADITERRRIADALDLAKQQAEQANRTKSRLLAAASHDLRQPLQTLALLQGLLANNVQGDKLQKLVARLGDALGAMSGMLNTLLDINQIKAGNVRTCPVAFSLQDLLPRLCREFAYQAEAQGLALRWVTADVMVQSDPRLLEQILRNLLANAVKYTKTGKVLVGCRRRPGAVSLEVWDTGVGIADGELLAIFDEYHQIDNDSRERSRGLGLGLSIVRRLAKLLGHRISVRSRPGKGSVFAVEIALSPLAATNRVDPPRRDAEVSNSTPRIGAILVVEDDPDLRELLQALLIEEGHFAVSAPDGPAALKLVQQGAIRPDLLLADFNLPNGLSGLQLAAQLRQDSRPDLSVVILTGDIATSTARDIAAQHCAKLNKPVKIDELSAAIQRFLPRATIPQDISPAALAPGGAPDSGDVVFVVDDDNNLRQGIRFLLEEFGHEVRDFADCESFLESFRPGQGACLLIDAYLPRMKGLELLQRLKNAGHPLPTIMITGHSDVPMAVQAMKSGAYDFLEKPFSRSDLLASLDRALEQSRDAGKVTAWQKDAADRVAGLTPRQFEIMELVLAGHPSKNIAADLHISQRTVENHRASIMEKTGSKSLPALARLALAAAQRHTG
jgi:two-component system CheB/CheR fusion protein